MFFDTLELQYEYEKEGFELPCGRYLPDFFLPEIGYWFEVKGQYEADAISKNVARPVPSVS